MINKEVMKAWIEKKKTSKQNLYQLIKKKREQSDNLLTKEEATYICASKEGIDLHKYLPMKEVEKIRRLIKQYDEGSFQENKPSSPQKNKKIKISSFSPLYETEFINEANLNNKVYPHIYVIENTLRKVILEEFGDDKKWWEKEIISKDVIETAQNIQKAESKHPWIPKRGKHPIYYVGLEELYRIINKNWDGHFKWIGHREKFHVWIDELIPIRNIVAHNCPINNQDLKTVEEKARYITTLINTQLKSKD